MGNIHNNNDMNLCYICYQRVQYLPDNATVLRNIANINSVNQDKQSRSIDY